MDGCFKRSGGTDNTLIRSMMRCGYQAMADTRWNATVSRYVGLPVFQENQREMREMIRSPLTPPNTTTPRWTRIIILI